MSLENKNDKLVCIAKFGKANGIRGLIKLISFSDDVFAYPFFFDLENNKYIIKKSFQKDDHFIVSFNDNDSRTIAENLQGKELYILRDMLPKIKEDEFYYNDLIGLNVLDQEQKHIAKIISVHNFGAGDLIEVEFIEDEKREYLPFSKEFIVELDLERNYLQYKFF